MLRIIFVFWRKLNQQTSQLPTIVQGKHQRGESVQFLLQRPTEAFKSLMSYGLGKLRVEHEASRRIPVPAQDHSLLRKSVEGRVYLGRWKDLAVESELALAGAGVEDTDPFCIRPA